ncbi:MAG: outer membrane beta-barrel protein [Flavobacterium sp.]
MKSSITILLLLLVSLAATAQSSVVTGRVKDAANGPVPFAEVSLAEPDSTLNQWADDNGLFELKGLNNGTFVLKVKALGFKDYVKEVTINGKTSVGDIILEEDVQQLDEVTVTAKRPIVRRKIDRLEFDVENSTLSSENAWEILKKTPGVNSAGGGLAIRGSGNILVLINDKRVYLSGQELQNLLENTAGDDIKSIEVITNPPAKYEAQGTAVLNIKMKKNFMKGYKSTISAAYVQSTYPKGVVFTSQNYKTDKFSVYGSYMYGSGTYLELSNSRREYSNDAGQLTSVWKSNNDANFQATQQNSYNFNMQFEPDSTNTFNIGASGFASLKSTAEIDHITRIYNGTGNLDSLYTSRNRRSYPQKNNTVNGFYEHKFSDKTNINISGDYSWYYTNEGQDIAADFMLPNAAPYRRERINSDDNRRFSLLSLQADFVTRKDSSGFEAGIRFGNVNADTQLIFKDSDGGEPMLNTGLSNEFLYDENIFAAYAGYDMEMGKWSLKAGLRGEYTSLEGNSVTISQVNTQEYFKLFPTTYALYKSSDNHHIGFSYGKRIVRPQYGWLSPFRAYSNPYIYNTGDPRLQPTIAHNFSLLYTLKQKFNFDLYYRHERDPALQIQLQDYATGDLVRKYTNIEDNNSVGLDFNTNLQLFTWWEMGLSTNAGYFRNTFQGIDGSMQKLSRFTYYGSADNRFILTKAKDLTANASYYYVSKSVSGVMEYEPYSGLTLSVRKTFFKGDGELTLIGTDLLKTERYKSTVEYGNQNLYDNSYGDSRSVRIQFRYRFGNQKLEGARERQRTEEQNRI